MDEKKIEISHADADGIVHAMSDYQKLAQRVLELVLEKRQREKLPYNDDSVQLIFDTANKIKMANSVIWMLRHSS